MSEIQERPQLSSSRVPNGKALAFLGVFHLACLSAVVLIPMFKFSLEGVAPGLGDTAPIWAMPVILANALVAMGVTAPLSQRKRGTKWRSLWALWLLLGYVIGSILLRNGGAESLLRPDILTDSSSSSLFPPFMNQLMTVKTGPYDLPISVACLLVIGVCVGLSPRKSVLAVGWRNCALMLVLVIAVRWNVQLLNFPCYFLIWLGCYIAYSSLGRRWLGNSIVAAVCISALIAAVFVYRLGPIILSGMNLDVITNMLVFQDLYQNFGRIIGITYSPHMTLMWLLSIVPFALSVALSATNGLCRSERLGLSHLLLLPLVVLVLAILPCARRAPYVALLLLIPVWLIVSRRIRLRKVLLMVISALILIVVLTITGVVPLESLILFNGSAGDRAVMAKASWDIFRQHPITGLGFGWWEKGFISWAQTHFVSRPEIWDFPHNEYLALLSEGGIIGFLLAMGAGFQLIGIAKQAAHKEALASTRYLLFGLCTQMITLGLSYAAMLGIFYWAQWLFPTSAIAAGLFGAVWTEDEQPRQHTENAP